jgi:hypothetical protein
MRCVVRANSEQVFEESVVVSDVPNVSIPKELSCLCDLHSSSGVTHEQNSELETFPSDKCEEERFRGRRFFAR